MHSLTALHLDALCALDCSLDPLSSLLSLTELRVKHPPTLRGHLLTALTALTSLTMPFLPICDVPLLPRSLLQLRSVDAYEKSIFAPRNTPATVYAGWDALLSMPLLSELDITHKPCGVLLAGIGTRLSTLRALERTRCGSQPTASLAPLSMLTALTVWGEFHPLQNQLDTLTGLRVLSLSDVRAFWTHRSSFAPLIHLTELRLLGCWLHNDNITALAALHLELPALRTLDISANHGLQNLLPLSAFSWLTQLAVRQCAGDALLPPLPFLTFLDLGGSDRRPRRALLAALFPRLVEFRGEMADGDMW